MTKRTKLTHIPVPEMSRDEMLVVATEDGCYTRLNTTLIQALTYCKPGGAALETVLCQYTEHASFTTKEVSDMVQAIPVDTDYTGAIHGFGSAGVSSAGAVVVKVTSPVVDKFSAGANYTEGYTPVNPSSYFESELLPSVSAALGGYMQSAQTNGHNLPKSTGQICDDVVGEVPDKTVCATGHFHLGGLQTDKPVKEGNFDVTVPLKVSYEKYNPEPSPSGSKLVASNHSYMQEQCGQLHNVVDAVVSPQKIAAEMSAEKITDVVLHRGVKKTVAVGGALVNSGSVVVTSVVRVDKGHVPHWFDLTSRIDNGVTTGRWVHHTVPDGCPVDPMSNVKLVSLTILDQLREETGELLTVISEVARWIQSMPLFAQTYTPQNSEEPPQPVSDPLYWESPAHALGKDVGISASVVYWMLSS